jgi:hypothetical protein
VPQSPHQLSVLVQSSPCTAVPLASLSQCFAAQRKPSSSRVLRELEQTSGNHGLVSPSIGDKGLAVESARNTAHLHPLNSIRRNNRSMRSRRKNNKVEEDTIIRNRECNDIQYLCYILIVVQIVISLYEHVMLHNFIIIYNFTICTLLHFL